MVKPIQSQISSIEPMRANATLAESNIPVTIDQQTNDTFNKESLPADKAKKMTESMNKFLETTTTELRYQYHGELDTYYVTLVNTQTDEIVREIPSKKLLDMYASMLNFVGIVIDKKI